MRLTEKNNTGYLTSQKYFPSKAFENKNELESAALLLNKVGQLEDIEEELGIDLITLYKALKNGIYAYDHANNIDHMKILNIFYDAEYIECQTDFDGDIFEYDFENYGETWALTREELN